jgi:O-antigen/teichoic acid export membrane protein
MMLMIPSATCNFFSPAYRAVFNGLEQAARVSTIDMVLSWSPLLAIPFLRFGPPAVVVAVSFVAIISIGIQSFWMRRLIRFKPIFDKALWKQLILGGIPFCVNNYLLSLYGAVSVFMVRHTLGDEGVGVVGQVGKLFGTFMFIPTALVSAILPSLARLAEANMAEFNRTKVRVLSLLMVVGLPVTAIVVVLAPPLCHLLYSKSKFLDMPLALQTIAIGLIPTYVVSTMYQFLVAQGRAHVWARFLLMTVVIYGIVSYISIPMCVRLFHNGPMGASVATVIAETISAVVSMILLKIKIFDAEMIGRSIRGLVATAVMCAVMFFLERWLESLAPKGGMISFAVQLFIPAGVGTVVFAVLAWALQIMLPEEQKKVAGMFRRVTGKLRPKTAS